jgi:DNA polymerase-1
MIDLDQRLRAESLRTRLLLQVHDELLLEAPAEEAARATALTVEAMSGVAHLRVPLSVEVGTGKSWAEAH